MRKLLLGYLFTTIAFAQNNQVDIPEHKSQLNIPLNNANYSVFEEDIYKAENVHTAIKPYTYERVNTAFDFDAYKNGLRKDKTSWGGRKLWNEHLFQTQGEHFWVNADILFDLQAGRDNTDVGTTLKNERIARIQGQLGSKFSFNATIYETQAKFTQYYDEFVKINQPEDANGLIPGRSKSKDFGEKGHDYGVSTGYISYTPSQFFNVQFGHGKNFIGDGYRSMFLSDVAGPRTYAKLTTTIGKVQYINIWTWLKDFNSSIDDPSFGNNAGHKRKYGTFHYLSWNVNDWLNLGFFEGIITDNSGGSGAYDAELLNPVIFYKNNEFANGEDAGSGVVGLSTKVKLRPDTHVYGQFLLDEFTADKFFTSGYWGNKYAIQLGAKYFDAFGVDGLQLQAEFNSVRPFTYSHHVQHNYAHFGQPLAHLWGSNFWEAIFIARFNKDRWAVNSKLIYGKKGFDIDGDETSFGGNIFVDSDLRSADDGQENLQGNLAELFHIDVKVSYLVNPVNNLKIYAGALLRNFSADSNITRVGVVPESRGFTFNTENTSWFRVGIKADLFNHYDDF